MAGGGIAEALPTHRTGFGIDKPTDSGRETVRITRPRATGTIVRASDLMSLACHEWKGADVAPDEARRARYLASGGNSAQA